MVVVLSPESGPMVTEHIITHWPNELDVSFVTQDASDSEVLSILCARSAVASSPFGLAQGETTYSVEAFAALYKHLLYSSTYVVASCHLEDSGVEFSPATRGVLGTQEGTLMSIIVRQDLRFSTLGYVASDGLSPRSLDPLTQVSAGLWGFPSSFWDDLAGALATTPPPTRTRLLLGDVINALLAVGKPVSVIKSPIPAIA
jgi:hypothetical protein